MLCGVAQKDN